MQRLSRAAQLEGQRRLSWAVLCNPLGANLTIGPLLALLALHYQATDAQMGLLYAAPFLAALVAIFGPVVCNGLDLSRIVALAWHIRAWISCGYLFLPLLSSNQAKVLLLISVCYGFMALRSFGMTAQAPQWQALARPRELPALTARVMLGWHLGTLATTVLSWFVLSMADIFPDIEWSYILLLSIGIIFNHLTGWLLGRLPPTGRLDGGSLGGVVRAALSVWQQAQQREVIWLMLAQIPMAICAGYQLNHLKAELGFDDDAVFLITLGSVSAAIVGTKLLALLGHRISQRALLFSTHALLSLGALSWTWLPASWTNVAVGLYIVSAFLLATSGTVCSSIATARLPEEDRFHVSLIFQLTTVAGALLGLGLVNIGTHLQLPIPGGHNYSLVFIIWTACCALLMLWAWRSGGGGTVDIRQELAALTPGNVYTVLRLHRLERKLSDAWSPRAMEGVLASDTPAGHEHLLELLHSPETRHRYAALRALTETPHQDAAPFARREAADQDSPLRHEAITALGFLRDRESLPLLRKCLDDEDPHLAACAAKALCRIGEAPERRVLIDLWKRCPARRAQMDLLIGMAAARDAASHWAIIGLELPRQPSTTWITTLFLSLATCADARTRLAELFGLESEHAGAGIADLCGELEDRGVDSSLITAVSIQDFSKLNTLLGLPAPFSTKNTMCLIGLVWCHVHPESRYREG